MSTRGNGTAGDEIEYGSDGLPVDWVGPTSERGDSAAGDVVAIWDGLSHARRFARLYDDRKFDSEFWDAKDDALNRLAERAEAAESLLEEAREALQLILARCTDPGDYLSLELVHIENDARAFLAKLEAR